MFPMHCVSVAYSLPYSPALLLFSLSSIYMGFKDNLDLGYCCCTMHNRTSNRQHPFLTAVVKYLIHL